MDWNPIRNFYQIRLPWCQFRIESHSTPFRTIRISNWVEWLWIQKNFLASDWNSHIVSDSKLGLNWFGSIFNRIASSEIATSYFGLSRNNFDRRWMESNPKLLPEKAFLVHVSDRTSFYAYQNHFELEMSRILSNRNSRIESLVWIYSDWLVTDLYWCNENLRWKQEQGISAERVQVQEKDKDSRKGLLSWLESIQMSTSWTYRSVPWSRTRQSAISPSRRAQSAP